MTKFWFFRNVFQIEEADQHFIVFNELDHYLSDQSSWLLVRPEKLNLRIILCDAFSLIFKCKYSTVNSPQIFHASWEIYMKKDDDFPFFSKPALLARKCLVAPCLVPLAPAEAKPPSKELRWCAIISHFMASSTLYFKVCKLFRYLEIWVFWPQVFSAEVVLIIICCY